jgi:hypothetical protein
MQVKDLSETCSGPAPDWLETCLDSSLLTLYASFHCLQPFAFFAFFPFRRFLISPFALLPFI